MLKEVSKESNIDLIKKALISKEPTAIPKSFMANYFAVYGTLRMGQGNYDWALKNRAEYVDTVRLQGFAKHRGLSASFTGNPEDSLVVDIFKIKPEYFEEGNYSIDRLEGCKLGVESKYGYLPYLVPVMLSNGTTVWTKFYQYKSSSQGEEDGDYISDQVSSNKAAFLNHINKYHPETADNFINFYNL